jgi:hypothetical protein
MPSSTLDPDNIPEPDRQLGKGHGNKALGPSDISDTGSDVQGGLRSIDEPELGLGLDRGTTEDSDTHNIEASDENEDSTGTGEDSTAGRDADVDLNADIGTDRIDRINQGADTGLETAPDDLRSPRRRPDEQRRPHR